MKVSVLTMSTSRMFLRSCRRPSAVKVSFWMFSLTTAAVTHEQATADGVKRENFSSEKHNSSPYYFN